MVEYVVGLEKLGDELAEWLVDMVACVVDLKQLEHELVGRFVNIIAYLVGGEK